MWLLRQVGGHTRADCRKKEADSKAGVGGLEGQPGEAAKEVGGLEARAAAARGPQARAAAAGEVSWIFGLNDTMEDPMGYIMIDSGSDVHVCPMDWGWGPSSRDLPRASTTELRHVSGGRIEVKGDRQVSFRTPVGKAEARFVVANSPSRS